MDLLQQQSQTGEKDGTCQVHEDNKLDELFGALSDRECRKILQQTQRDALSAKELSDRCDIPRSTVYRKLQTLVDAELLAERIRFISFGQFTHEYALRAESIHIGLTGESGVSLSLTQLPESVRRTDKSSQELSAD